MKKLGTLAFLVAVLFGVFSCDLIEQADQIKEKVDNADFEIKRAVEEEVEKKLDEKVNKLREEGADVKMVHKAMGKDPTAASVMALRNGKKIEFKSILNFQNVTGRSNGKKIEMAIGDLKEIEFLTDETICGVPGPQAGKLGGSCRLRLSPRKGGPLVVEKTTIVLHESGKKPDRCEYIGKLKGSVKSPEKELGISRIKKISFEN